MDKIPMKKLIFGSIGVGLILTVLSITVIPRCGTLGLVGWALLVLFGIEKARQQLVKKYHIGLVKFMVLTMLPSVLVYGIYVCLYISMPQPELEGLLDI